MKRSRRVLWSLTLVFVLAAPAARGRPADGRRSTGWALGGAIMGFVAAPTVLGLAVGAEVTKGDDYVPALPLGGTAILLTNVFSPLVALSASSARSSVRDGLLGLRISGWITYGGAVIMGMTQIVLGAQGEEPPDGLPAATGAIAATSMILHGVDGLVGRSEAGRGYAASLDVDEDEGFAVVPFLSATPDGRGGGGGLLGLAGVF